LTTLLEFAVDTRTRGGDACAPRFYTDRMNDTALATVAATGFAVAFLHAMIPTHWLPFVLVARARRWPTARTMMVATAAGLGHVLLTSLLGLGIAWFGFQLDEELGHIFPWIAGAILFVLGGYYGWRQFRGRGICHHHPPGTHHAPSEDCGHEDEHTHWDEEMRSSRLVAPDTGDWAAISGLFVMLTFSPCEAFLPVYLSGVQFGWRGFFVLSVILAVATLAGMALFTWLTLLGFDRLKVQRLERHESGLLAVLFVVLGLIVVLLDHGHD
jgi:nickel/cobalt transporter (NicO) family protein